MAPANVPASFLAERQAFQMRIPDLSWEISPLLDAENELDARRAANLQIFIRRAADITILDLRGRSTMGDESDFLSRRIQGLVADGAHKLLLDLRDVTQVDSSGIGVIVAMYVSLRSKDGDLRMLCSRGRVLELLTLLRLPKRIPIFEDETQALASFPRSADFECEGFQSS